MDLLFRQWFIFLIIIKEIQSMALVIKVPEYVKVDENVTLACEYDLEGAELYDISWYCGRMKFYQFRPKDSPPSMAFTWRNVDVDLAKSGANNVTLRRVQKDDCGSFSCEVTVDEPTFFTLYKDAIMNVIDVPSHAPHILISMRSEQRIEIGVVITADCSVEVTKYSYNITWSINKELTNSSDDTVLLHPPELVGNRIESQIELVAQKSYFSKGPMVLRCHATMFNVWSSFTERFIFEDEDFANASFGQTTTRFVYYFHFITMLMYYVFFN